ncbi:MAG: alpha-hydroxy acid oxidase [Dehalococcoidia bacterium]
MYSAAANHSRAEPGPSEGTTSNQPPGAIAGNFETQYAGLVIHADLDRLVTIPAIVDAARRALPAELWDYSCGGSESETTLRRNRSAFDEIAFRPRVLRDVSRVDIGATFLGEALALPIMLAPVGSIGHFDTRGALACAGAAHRNRTAAFVSSLSTPDLETVSADRSGPLYFQLYMSGSREWAAGIVRRVEEAGYAGLCLTVDSAAYSRRERDLHNRFVPMGGIERPNLRDLGPASSRRQGPRGEATVTWETVDWLRSTTRLPLMLKGIMTDHDARLAVEHGADVVYVSNHGGRQLDHLPAAIDVLPEIVAAVDGRAEVLVDSGFMRGSDVVKALCLGARAVLIGKLMLWGLAAAGEPGLVRTLEILAQEIRITMANLGAVSIADLVPGHLRPARAPAAAPWPIA